MDEIYEVVHHIPAGKCAGYGTVGRVLAHPVSGLLVGRWMHRCPDGVPWWRVVAKDGALVIARLSPDYAHVQRLRLEAEGVTFVKDRVAQEHLLGADELEAILSGHR